MTKIIIVGGGFANKGAEAMIISTISTLSQIISDTEFVIVANYTMDDVNKVKQYNAMILPYTSLRKRVIDLLSALLCRTVPLRCVHNILLKGNDKLIAFSDTDLVIDISGFALTDQFGLLSSLIYCSNIVLSQLFRVPFVIYPQSMGPFSRISTKVLVKVFLPLADTVIVRGEMTKNYLDELGIDKKKNLYVCADTAFLFNSASSEQASEIMQKHNIKRGENGLIGIVPNMEIYKRTKGMGNENIYVKFLARICDVIQHELNASILFLPHRYKDDMRIINLIMESLDQTEQVYTINEDYSASELKALIGQMDLLIASRYHSAIAALSMRTPVMVLGWSHKYVELMTMIGHEDYVVDCRHVSYEELKEKVDEMWYDRAKIKQTLGERVPELEKSSREAALLVKKTLDSRR